MTSRALLVALVSSLALPSAMLSQDAAATIRQEGASPLAKGITFPASKDLTYRIAWAVNVGPDKPDSIVPGFRSPANFLYVGDANGVQIIVCGQALINRKLASSDLLPFVQVAPTATMALATLHAQGYGIFRP